MSLRKQIRRLEERILPLPDRWEDVDVFRIGWEPAPLKVELKPGERIVRDVYKRQTRNRNWMRKGIVFEFIHVRDRVTRDPSDNGRTCGEDSQLDDVVAEISAQHERTAS